MQPVDGCWPNFNPLAPFGARPALPGTGRAPSNFNPLAPCGARRRAPWKPPGCSSNFNPLAPCGARRLLGILVKQLGQISIHSPLAGRDVGLLGLLGALVVISIHSPLAGRDIPVIRLAFRGFEISIHSPLAGRDHDSPPKAFPSRDFNPLAPCGARPLAEGVHQSANSISIHSPLAGRDRELQWFCAQYRRFQSTRPLRGETFTANSTTPSSPLFQSTRPLRGETLDLYTHLSKEKRFFTETWGIDRKRVDKRSMKDF